MLTTSDSIKPAQPMRLARNMLLFVCVVASAVGHSAEPAYPARPVRMLVGFPPGGGVDAIARIISPKLTDAMGATWVVDNRGAAGGNLATEIVARANPDGYTVLMALSSQLTVNPNLYKLSFSVEKDLQPIALLASGQYMLVVHPSVPAASLKEFVALAKEKPRLLNYASAGVGSPLHLAAELFKKRAGIDLVHIAYKGGGPAAASVVAGETQVLFGSVASTIGFVTAGRLRALATTGAKRAKGAPDLPTIAESGYPGFDSSAWFALLAPAGTPKAIVDSIHDEAIKALNYPDAQTALARQGLDPDFRSPKELAALIKRETSTYAALIKDAGIRAE